MVLFYRGVPRGDPIRKYARNRRKTYKKYIFSQLFRTKSKTFLMIYALLSSCLSSSGSSGSFLPELIASEKYFSSALSQILPAHPTGSPAYPLTDTAQPQLPAPETVDHILSTTHAISSGTARAHSLSSSDIHTANSISAYLRQRCTAPQLSASHGMRPAPQLIPSAPAPETVAHISSTARAHSIRSPAQLTLSLTDILRSISALGDPAR